MRKENIPNQPFSEILKELHQKNERNLQEKKQRQFEESKRVMKELGVTRIFEELRDKQILTYYRHEKKGFFGLKYEINPATIEYSSDYIGVLIYFDAKQVTDRNWDVVLRSPNNVSVIKQDNDILVCWYDSSSPTGGQFKTQKKEELPNLISQAILKTNPNIKI